MDTTAPIEKKRTRTGCNICRERHLKCDEAKPHCSQCVKRKRTGECSYGLQLKFSKFLDVREPPTLCVVTGPYKVQDESAIIASEYVGGEEQYAAINQPGESTKDQSCRVGRARPGVLGNVMNLLRDSDQSFPIDSPLQTSSTSRSRGHQYAQKSPADSNSQGISAPNSAMLGNLSEKQTSFHPQDYQVIEDCNDQFFMEVFVEQIACCLDTMNTIRYVSNATSGAVKQN